MPSPHICIAKKQSVPYLHICNKQTRFLQLLFFEEITEKVIPLKTAVTCFILWRLEPVDY